MLFRSAETPLKSLATLSTPDSQTIQIQPFDAGSVAQIEKAIAMSDLGLTPNNDGKIIRINIPPLTEEFFSKSRWWKPVNSLNVLVEVDPDTLAWFQSQGEDYGKKMAAALRIYAEAHKAF